MSCLTCGDEKHPDVRGKCRVCELVDNDSNDNKRVKHCKVCNAYICEKHWLDAPARFEAAAKELAQSISEGVKNLFTNKDEDDKA